MVFTMVFWPIYCQRPSMITTMSSKLISNTNIVLPLFCTQFSPLLIKPFVCNTSFDYKKVPVTEHAWLSSLSGPKVHPVHRMGMH